MQSIQTTSSTSISFVIGEKKKKIRKKSSGISCWTHLDFRWWNKWFCLTVGPNNEIFSLHIFQSRTCEYKNIKGEIRKRETLMPDLQIILFWNFLIHQNFNKYTRITESLSLFILFIIISNFFFRFQNNYADKRAIFRRWSRFVFFFFFKFTFLFVMTCQRAARWRNAFVHLIINLKKKLYYRIIICWNCQFRKHYYEYKKKHYIINYKRYYMITHWTYD